MLSVPAMPVALTLPAVMLPVAITVAELTAAAVIKLPPVTLPEAVIVVHCMVELPMEYVAFAVGIKCPLTVTEPLVLAVTVASDDAEAMPNTVVVVVNLRTSITSPELGASVNVNVVVLTL